MIITAPVTDYIPASILTTLHDIVKRGATDPERLAELEWRGVHIGTDIFAANGNQTIGGTGFLPRSIIFIARDNTPLNKNFSVGFSNRTINMCMMLADTGQGYYIETSDCIYIRRPGGNLIHGLVTALQANGFRITWTLVGACTAEFIYLCYS